MMLTIWTKKGRKSIHLPDKAMAKVRKYLKDNDDVIDYCIGTVTKEKEKITNEQLSK